MSLGCSNTRRMCTTTSTASFFHHDHVPMKLTKDTLRRLLCFRQGVPHYFIGSNADLPSLGGSILTHDHYQGGRHTFAIKMPKPEAVFRHAKAPGLTRRVW